MSSYDALAASYDALTVDVEYRRRADYLTRQFHRSALPVETVLDLACGTGTMACLLAERGYRMIAVDGSEEMLTQAAWKAAALEQPPMFDAKPRFPTAGSPVAGCGPYGCRMRAVGPAIAGRSFSRRIRLFL